MKREYQCTGCGSRMWSEWHLETCTKCTRPVRATGRFIDPSLIEPSEGRTHTRHSKYAKECETATPTYHIHLDDHLLQDIFATVDLTKEE